MKTPSLLLIVLALVSCAKSGPSDTPVEAAARRTCMDTIEARATKPKSITYLDNGQAVGHTRANGQLDVTMKLSAKNEIGMASTLSASCVLSADGKSLVEIQVRDAR